MLLVQVITVLHRVVVHAAGELTRLHELVTRQTVPIGDAFDLGRCTPGTIALTTQDVNLKRLGAVLAMAHDNEIDNFEDLLMLKGVGPRTLKSLALVSEVIHGDASRFEDPARFSFAVGGKDGRPHPIDKQALDETIEHLQDSVEKSKLGYNDKSKALKRLHHATRHIETTRAPEAHLDELENSEWQHAEDHDGMTFAGKVIPGVTRAIFSLQNSLLYGKQGDKSN